MQTDTGKVVKAVLEKMLEAPLDQEETDVLKFLLQDEEYVMRAMTIVGQICVNIPQFLSMLNVYVVKTLLLTGRGANPMGADSIGDEGSPFSKLPGRPN